MGEQRKQVVIGDGKSGRPYPEEIHPDARITKRALLAAIRSLQEGMQSEIVKSEDRLVEKLEANSLGDLKREVAELKEDMADLKTDMAYVKARVAGSEEIAVINENIQALREHAGI